MTGRQFTKKHKNDRPGNPGDLLFGYPNVAGFTRTAPPALAASETEPVTEPDVFFF